MTENGDTSGQPYNGSQRQASTNSQVERNLDVYLEERFVTAIVAPNALRRRLQPICPSGDMARQTIATMSVELDEQVPPHGNLTRGVLRNVDARLQRTVFQDFDDGFAGFGEFPGETQLLQHAAVGW